MVADNGLHLVAERPNPRGGLQPVALQPASEVRGSPETGVGAPGISLERQVGNLTAALVGLELRVARRAADVAPDIADLRQHDQERRARLRGDGGLELGSPRVEPRRVLVIVRGETLHARQEPGVGRARRGRPDDEQTQQQRRACPPHEPR